MEGQTTVWNLITAGPENSVAVAAPGRRNMTYEDLRAHVENMVRALNAHGIGRNDRVAIVLPNGPEMATAFLGVAAGATTAPLNPAYRTEDFEFYLSDLDAKALLVEQGSQSPAVAVAAALKIPVLELTADPADPAGTFDIRADGSKAPPKITGFAGPEDIALVLHTSGTTSRPKIVPLAQRNICASARHISATLALTPEDRCLNIMPLFHIHGLIAAVLSSQYAGGSIFCTPGFNALRFFSWMEEAKATWYTAVPTMHQAILARAARSKDIMAANPLRFIRSSSASLPAQVMRELEQTFNAPVIEAYGMTEAAHQMASNPLPPGSRKPGTVGIAAGPDVAIMDESGTLLPPGELGEVVIRGPNVTAGYENNPKANEQAFTNGWFRTGDQGVMDADGYLTLTGRLKEIINRGGEKISPREIDDVLMDHPAVAQVVTFATTHPMLGEDVACAIVLRDGISVTEIEIREFAANRLTHFKIPSKVLFLSEIPKGATGKLQRIGLAKKLGLD